MQCYVCEAPARGVCQFCGAGVCRDHAKRARHVSGVLAWGEGIGPTELADYAVVEDALWCGRCSVLWYTEK